MSKRITIFGSDGLTGLDLMNAFAFYALEKFNNSYTGDCLRVRRTGDNAEQNFGYNDWTNLVAWVVAGGGTQHGAIVSIFDQINNKTATQVTPSAQPYIVRSGVLTVDSQGNPAMDFTHGNHYIERNETFPTTPVTAFSISQADGSNGTTRTIWTTGTLNANNTGYGNHYGDSNTKNSQKRLISNNNGISISALTLGQSTLITSVFDTNSHTASTDNDTEITQADAFGAITPNQRFTIGVRRALATYDFYLNGKVTGIFIYTGVKTNRVQINQFLMNKYDI
jgi:hypothetical protein